MAPAFSSAATTSVWPFWAVTNSGVREKSMPRPSVVGVFALAPAFSSSATISVWPFRARAGATLDVAARDLKTLPDQPARYWNEPKERWNLVELDKLFDFGDTEPSDTESESDDPDGPPESETTTAEVASVASSDTEVEDYDGGEVVRVEGEEEDLTVAQERDKGGEERELIDDDGMGRGELADPANDAEFAGKSTEVADPEHPTWRRHTGAWWQPLPRVHVV